MNWEAIGAIGEIISAIGVIGTLIYLSLQIRSSTHESRLVANSDIARDYNTALQTISSDEKLSKIWVSALEDFESLPQDEKARAIMLNGNVARIIENAYLQYRSGRMPEESWEGYEKILRRGMSSKMFSHYWEIRGAMHNQSFQDLVTQLSESVDEGRFF